MTTKRQHNEYFRRVYVRSVKGTRTRPKELIDQIMAREGNTLSRELLEKPYECYVGEESSRKSCPNCGEKLAEGEWIWSWGEYINAKWNTVLHFCRECYPKDVKDALLDHRSDCGCDFNLIGYSGEVLPDWLILPPKCEECYDDKFIICPQCNGEGYDSPEHTLECNYCMGRGTVDCDECS